MTAKKSTLHWKILLSLVLAVSVAVGLRTAELTESTFGMGLLELCRLIGVLFMNALKMIVIPIIVSSVIMGMFKMGGGDFRRLGLKTLVYYLSTSLIAIVIGLSAVNLIAPGIVSEETATKILGGAVAPDTFIEKVEGRSGADLANIFVRMVPPNIVGVMGQNNQLLGVIIASLLFGFFLNQLPPKLRDPQEVFWEGIQRALINFTDLVIRFAPIGVFGLVTPVLVRTGWDLLVPLTLFFVTVMLALSTHFFITMGLILRFIGGINPIRHFKAMDRVLLTAFSTASSSATLPVTLDTLEKEAGVSNRVACFTLPLGATVNMDGTALYECVVVIFVAQFYSVVGDFQIDFAMQFTVVLLALLTSIGVAGIPAASLVAITVILGAVGLPIESIGLVIAIDRILDMCRTAVNVFGDSVGAVVIAKSEGEAVYS